MAAPQRRRIRAPGNRAGGPPTEGTDLDWAAPPGVPGHEEEPIPGCACCVVRQLRFHAACSQPVPGLQALMDKKKLRDAAVLAANAVPGGTTNAVPGGTTNAVPGGTAQQNGILSTAERSTLPVTTTASGVPETAMQNGSPGAAIPGGSLDTELQSGAAGAGTQGGTSSTAALEELTGSGMLSGAAEVAGPRGSQGTAPQGGLSGTALHSVPVGTGTLSGPGLLPDGNEASQRGEKIEALSQATPAEAAPKLDLEDSGAAERNRQPHPRAGRGPAPPARQSGRGRAAEGGRHPTAGRAGPPGVPDAGAASRSGPVKQPAEGFAGEQAKDGPRLGNGDQVGRGGTDFAVQNELEGPHGAQPPLAGAQQAKAGTKKRGRGRGRKGSGQAGGQRVGPGGR
jgi:hypothetical protein